MAALTQAETDTKQAGNPVATQAQARMALVRPGCSQVLDGTLPGKWKPDLRIGVSIIRKQHPRNLMYVSS